VGFVTAFPSLLTPYVNPSDYEYTVVLDELTATDRWWDPGAQFLNVFFGNSGRFRLLEDGKPGCSSCTPGTPAEYGASPPNATAPSTFADGTLALGGLIRNFIIWYDYQQDTGGYYTTIEIDEGTLKPYLTWLIGGFGVEGSFDPTASRPEGYTYPWSALMQADCPVSKEPQRGLGPNRSLCSTPTRQSTWGAVKAIYR
jgi:hypothetical protein